MHIVVKQPEGEMTFFRGARVSLGVERIAGELPELEYGGIQIHVRDLDRQQAEVIVTLPVGQALALLAGLCHAFAAAYQAGQVPEPAPGAASRRHGAKPDEGGEGGGG